MKKMNARQMMLCMAGSVMCSVGVMGCYPLVPAYFAALYLERVSGPVLLGMMYIGMFVFMPTAAAVKYAVALVVVMGAIRLVEWAERGMPLLYGGQYGSDYYHDPVGRGGTPRMEGSAWDSGGGAGGRVYIGSRDSF